MCSFGTPRTPEYRLGRAVQNLYYKSNEKSILLRQKFSAPFRSESERSRNRPGESPNCDDCFSNLLQTNLFVLMLFHFAV